MIKILLYNDKIFLNARSFYEFVLTNVFDGEEPNNWKLEYIAVCWTNKLVTIAGVHVSWVLIHEEDYLTLKNSPDGWLKWNYGKDKTFVEFMQAIGGEFTKEDIWRWAVDYVITYDMPRMRIKRFVDDVLELSEPVDKTKGVLLYRFKDVE